MTSLWQYRDLLGWCTRDGGAVGQSAIAKCLRATGLVVRGLLSPGTPASASSSKLGYLVTLNCPWVWLSLCFNPVIDWQPVQVITVGNNVQFLFLVKHDSLLIIPMKFSLNCHIPNVMCVHIIGKPRTCTTPSNIEVRLCAATLCSPAWCFLCLFKWLSLGLANYVNHQVTWSILS